MFIPVLTYMWYEGSGTEMFVIIVLITLMPDLLPNIVMRARVYAEQCAAAARAQHAIEPEKRHRYIMENRAT
jgi:hypothetical protein